MLKRKPKIKKKWLSFHKEDKISFFLNVKLDCVSYKHPVQEPHWLSLSIKMSEALLYSHSLFKLSKYSKLFNPDQYSFSFFFIAIVSYSFILDNIVSIYRFG